MKKIVLFASGSGSNAENIIQYFKDSESVEIAAVISNKPDAKVLERAANHQVPSFVFLKDDFSTDKVLNKIQEIQPDLIVLAGFLLKFPSNIVELYPNKIINIHPALLPKYGGKGMYGMNVHKAILENSETETGISIHYVDEHYDNGDMIFQQKVSITDCKTPEAIAQKVHELEHEHFPKVIERLLRQS
mgnify:CR=1 FL=1